MFFTKSLNKSFKITLFDMKIKVIIMKASRANVTKETFDSYYCICFVEFGIMILNLQREIKTMNYITRKLRSGVDGTKIKDHIFCPC